MNPTQAAAFIAAQTAMLLVELEAMKAANAHPFSGTEKPHYTEADFRDLYARYEPALGFNAVINIFQEAARYG